MWLSLARPLVGTWPATQACALTGNRTRERVSQASAHSAGPRTSQGYMVIIYRVLKRIPEVTPPHSSVMGTTTLNYLHEPLLSLFYTVGTSFKTRRLLRAQVGN